MNPNLAKAEKFLNAAQMAIQEAPKHMRAQRFDQVKLHADAALGLFNEVKNMIARGEVSAREVVELINLSDSATAELFHGLKHLEGFLQEVGEDNKEVADMLRPMAEALKAFLSLARI
ncbi:MAG: hypothetical protein OSB62_02870 [Alphaproteobacteria bacterium]|nr:hypothetical protein [Alphaproteobacteria bacterium]